MNDSSQPPKISVLCPIHPQEEMQEKTGKYGNFWSHRTDDPDFPNGWCNGRRPGGPYKAPIKEIKNV